LRKGRRNRVPDLPKLVPIPPKIAAADGPGGSKGWSAAGRAPSAGRPDETRLAGRYCTVGSTANQYPTWTEGKALHVSGALIVQEVVERFPVERRLSSVHHPVSDFTPDRLPRAHRAESHAGRSREGHEGSEDPV